MQAFILSDEEFHNDLFQHLYRTVIVELEGAGYTLTHTVISRGLLHSCAGCFGCWVQKPGECIVSDGIGEINRRAISSDLVVYLCPVVFGQFSANIKDVIDRWLPNMLPFFMMRPDGSTMHPPRYRDYPRQLIVGYGENLTQEDAQLFCDITKKHRSNVEAVIYNDDETLVQTMRTIPVGRIGGLL